MGASVSVDKRGSHKRDTGSTYGAIDKGGRPGGSVGKCRERLVVGAAEAG